MKVLIIGDRRRYEQFDEKTPFLDSLEKIYVPLEDFLEGVPASALDSDFIAADAIAPITAEIIEAMPRLKLIHSEGVAYDKIDVACARERGIYVCNNRGANAQAVAEQAILLMLALLRDAANGQRAVYEGNQLTKKEEMMRAGFRELGECTVGLIGLGAIGRASAKRLAAFGCKMLYTASHRHTPEEEEAYNVVWASIEDIQKTCDIVSLHIPVTPATTHMVDEIFLQAMRRDAYLINTARGDLIDNNALCKALHLGWIAGAGLDTIAPEPVSKDHPLLHLPAESKGMLLVSPHIGGVSGGLFRRTHRNIWKACEAVANGKVPDNLV